MKGSEWQIGIVGTFDVQNYGDLLFPHIAAAELTRRLGPLKLHRFSYHAQTPPTWPYDVTSLTELPRLIAELDGLLVGGGFLIRFDKEVAPGYQPPSAAIHHPTGYWLTPALMALQHNVPLIWNAPGMHCNEIPVWAAPLMKMAFSLARYIAVRDEPSQQALAHFTEQPIAVVPDTAFALAELLNGEPAASFNELCHATGLRPPYLVIQAALGLETFVRFIKNNAAHFAPYQIVTLPIGPVLGDHVNILGDDIPGLVRLPAWPHPLLLAKLISQAEAVIGHSYHLSITALATGVPAFTLQNLSVGKYTALSDFETIYQLSAAHEPDLDWFMSRIGKRTVAEAAQPTLHALASHWDGVAAALTAAPVRTDIELNRFWQTLPLLLETSAPTETL